MLTGQTNQAVAFENEKKANLEAMAQDEELARLSQEFYVKSCKYKYSYNFTWMGRPFIQLPQDIVAMQEIIWKVKPRVILETGIAHGGSTVFYASMLELLGGDGRVISVDVEIREHNRAALLKHPMAKRITMLEGSSTSETIFQQVKKLVGSQKPVLAVLDSNHTHDHVLKELELYSPLVTKGSYLVVFDTVIEDMPPDSFKDRPWSIGNNPKTAVREFLRKNDRFEIDREIANKLLISTVPDGYLRCVK